MLECPPSRYAPQLDDAALCKGVRDRMLVGLVLFTLVRSGEALAGDQASITNAAGDPQLANSRQSAAFTPAVTAAPRIIGAPGVTDIRAFSVTDFTPRKRTLFDRDPADFSFADAPMLRGTSVWERMSDYKSNDGVRLLTLWETRGSTVSLQASSRGDPSLQWSSRSMNHGGSTRGLLDRLFSVSLGGTGTGARSVVRPASVPAAAKPAAASVAAGQQQIN